ncbi:hypothetical protein [Massilia niabensis]|uniref:Uncharacterized protein n=1 Tax=Massilia niabensis TaxID=544910 RepID=A0ABW0L386_9BURK
MNYVRKKRLLAFEQWQSYGRKEAEARRKHWKPTHYVPEKKLLAFKQWQSYGRKGAEARRKQWNPVKKLAVKLAQEGGFTTRHEAARSIAKAVVGFAANVGVKMSDYHAPITIARWLEIAGVTFPNR